MILLRFPVGFQDYNSSFNFKPTIALQGQAQLALLLYTMSDPAIKIAESIFCAATPVLHIHRLEAPLWKRKIDQNPSDARIGPWLQARYTVLSEEAWRNRGVCLYMVKQKSESIRYVGISRNGVKHRWRTSPAYDANTMNRLPENQLFHSQCWRHMQSAFAADLQVSVEVRTIMHNTLAAQLSALGPPLSGFLALGDDGEGMCAAVERWLCNRSSGSFLSWNTAMTGRRVAGS